VQVTPSLFSEINYFQHSYIKAGLNSIKALTRVTKKNQTSLYLLVFVQFMKTNCTPTSVSKLCCRATSGAAHRCQQMCNDFSSLTTTQHILSYNRTQHKKYRFSLMCAMLLLSDSYNLQLTQNNAVHSITIAEMPNLKFHECLSRGLTLVLTKSLRPN